MDEGQAERLFGAQEDRVLSTFHVEDTSASTTVVFHDINIETAAILMGVPLVDLSIEWESDRFPRGLE